MFAGLQKKLSCLLVLGAAYAAGDLLWQPIESALLRVSSLQVPEAHPAILQDPNAERDDHHQVNRVQHHGDRYGEIFSVAVDQRQSDPTAEMVGS